MPGTQKSAKKLFESESSTHGENRSLLEANFEIDALKEKIKVYQDRIRDKEKTIIGLRMDTVKLKSANMTIQTLKEQNTKLKTTEGKLKDKEAILLNLRNENRKLVEANSTLKTDSEIVKRDKAQHERDLFSMKSEFSKLQTKLDNAQIKTKSESKAIKQLTDTKNELETVNKKTNDELKALQVSYKKLNLEVTSMKCEFNIKKVCLISYII